MCGGESFIHQTSLIISCYLARNHRSWRLTDKYQLLICGVHPIRPGLRATTLRVACTSRLSSFLGTTTKVHAQAYGIHTKHLHLRWTPPRDRLDNGPLTCLSFLIYYPVVTLLSVDCGLWSVLIRRPAAPATSTRHVMHSIRRRNHSADLLAMR